MLALAAREGVDLTVVGPEVPLSLGIVDLFMSRGRAIVGPTKAAAALESSKAFAKDFMARHAVPTARFRVCDSADAARAAIAGAEFGFPVVIKADGLYLMMYGCYWRDDKHTALGFAVSKDGLTWTKHPDNPVFRPEPSHDWESNFTTSHTLLPLAEGGFRLWYAGRRQPPDLRVDRRNERLGQVGAVLVILHGLVEAGEREGARDRDLGRLGSMRLQVEELLHDPQAVGDVDFAGGLEDRLQVDPDLADRDGIHGGLVRVEARRNGAADHCGRDARPHGP
jgi:hypothetical protein